MEATNTKQSLANETSTNTNIKSMPGNTCFPDQPLYAGECNKPNEQPILAASSGKPGEPKNELAKNIYKQSNLREVSLILTFFEHTNSRL